jgi:aspartate racemase
MNNPSNSTGRACGSIQPLPARSRAGKGPVPVSFAQQRLWFLEQLEPDSPLYNVSRAMRIVGPLNIEALRASLDNLIARHEPLRTTFVTVDHEPVQVVGEMRPIILAVIDLGNSSNLDRDAEIQLVLNEHAQRPFDLTRDLMLRATLLRLSEEEHVLLLTMHHIASDGWSLRVLLRDLASFYESFLTGQPPSLPDLTIQYQDYAVWQRQRLTGGVLAKELAYWKQQLRDAPPLLELPTNRSRPAFQSYQGARHFLTFPDALVEALKILSRRQQATLYMVMLAAFQTLLHRYSGQETIVVGSPIAGRTYKETEDLIGFFVNTLVLKTDLSGNPTFNELTARVRSTALGAYEHQDVPFEKLVEELNPDRSPSYSPLFQVALAFQNVPNPVFKLAGLQLIPLEVEGRVSKFDLTLFLTEHAGTLEATMEYNVDLFDKATIEQMLGHYQKLLESIVANPNRPLSDLAMLGSQEEHQLLVEWNDTQREYSSDKCIHQLFEQQAQNTPDSTAVVFANQALTYRQLNRRANQLARYLQRIGIGPEALVGICMDRSPEMVVGLLGILKAGGAYVPLDPGYPQERLKFMIDDTAVPVLLTHTRLLDKLPKHGARLLCLDREWDAISRESDENLPPQTSPENLAYVMYTSGSTGKPKGVEIPHRGITRLVDGAEYAEFNSSQVFLQLAPISFDASTFELWGALAHGAQCVLFPGTIPTVHELRAILEKHEITTLWLTASLFNTVIEQAPEALAGIRQLLTGGEALSIKHVRRALARLPNTQIINGYGPTESTTFACCYAIPKKLDPTLSAVPIGRPIANTEIYILDAQLKPVPIGVSGELTIGGPGLARGYLNRPDATAEQFVRNPFSGAPGARLYKTGDRARYLPNGEIEFLGRLDHQVKIRGFRIEPAEIENVLRRHPSVQSASVIVREDRPGNKILVAYVVTTQRSSLSANELRAFASDKLPDYMVPSVFIFVDAIPLTPNGKVDRLSLPLPHPRTAAGGGGYQAPRTPVEETLARIWAEVLGVERVGIHDNFFDLGGHSLLAVRVADLIEKNISRCCRVSAIFQAPTVAALAVFLNQAAAGGKTSSLVPLQTNGGKPPFFWIHGEISDALLPIHLGPEQPLYGLQHQSLDGRRALYTTVEGIAAHYLEEIRTVQPEGPFYLGGYCFGGLVAFEAARQLLEQNQKVALLALLEPPGEKRIAPQPAVPRPRASLYANLRRHLRAVSQLDGRGKWTYVADRVVGIIKSRIANSIIIPASKLTHSLICKTCERWGIPIPVALRESYILNIYREAMGAHAAQPLSVDMVLFLGDDFSQDARNDWCKRTVGTVTIHRVPGNHATVLSDRRSLKTWTEKLRGCLDAAQMSASRGQKVTQNCRDHR